MSTRHSPTWTARWSGIPACKHLGLSSRMLLEYDDGKSLAEGWPRPTFRPTKPAKPAQIGPTWATGGFRDRLYQPLCLQPFTAEILVRPPRFELGTFCSGGKRSIHLSYGRTCEDGNRLKTRLHSHGAPLSNRPYRIRHSRKAAILMAPVAARRRCGQRFPHSPVVSQFGKARWRIGGVGFRPAGTTSGRPAARMEKETLTRGHPLRIGNAAGGEARAT